MRSATARRLLVGTLLTVAALVSLGTGSALAVATVKTGTASNVTATSATVSGTITATNSDTAYAFVYGTSTNYTGRTAPVVAKVGTNTVTATISGLQPATTYHFELVADDAVVEPPAVAQGGDATFTTLQSPIAQTTSATNVAPTSATLNGVANPTGAAEYAFQYGTTTSYAKQTSAGTISAGSHNVSTNVTGLTPGTTYHFRIVVVQISSQGPSYDIPVAGSDATFTTPTSSGPGRHHHKKHKHGKVSLLSSYIKVAAGKADVHLRCSGRSSAHCAGKIALTVAGKTVGSAHFATHGGHKFVLQIPISVVVHTTLSAHLVGTFTTRQGKLKRKVVLAA
jgi:hypothetical protein